MEAETKTLPLENASILSEGSLQEGHRLWIGNLDPKITEYHLLKLLQKFGTVKQFDFLFHKSGALEGQPRGYCFVNFETKQEAEQAIQCLNGKLALSKKLVVRWAHAQVKRYDHNKNDKILPISLEPSSSTEPTQSNLSVTAKIKAIEAKLKMMAENPDAEYPAAPVYSYFKPPDKKRTTPYSRTAWKSRRWCLWITVAAKANWSPHLKPSAFVLCRCDWYSPAEHNPMLEFGKMTFLAVPMDVSTLKYVWNWASSRINRILSKIVIWTLGCSSWLVCLDL